MRKNGSSRGGAQNNKARGGTLLGVFIGLIIGILVALLVVWYINRNPAPFRSPTGAATPAGATVKNGPDGTATSGAGVLPLPGKPGDPPVEKRFQFYDILPGKSEPKPTAAPTDKAGAKTAVKAESKPGPLSLQVASFQTLKDAENQRIALTLMGHEANIQDVQVNGKQWFRVRIGPVTSFEELNRIKADLAKSGIQAVVVKPNE